MVNVRECIQSASDCIEEALAHLEIQETDKQGLFIVQFPQTYKNLLENAECSNFLHAANLYETEQSNFEDMAEAQYYNRYER